MPNTEDTYWYVLQYMPKHIQTNTRSNIDQYKHQYRRIHTLATFVLILEPVHANTGIGTVESIRRPRQHSLRRQHPLLQVCQRYLSLPSSTRPGQQNQPHPLVRCQTAPQCFVTAKLSTLPQKPTVQIQQNDHFMPQSIKAFLRLHCPAVLHRLGFHMKCDVPRRRATVSCPHCRLFGSQIHCQWLCFRLMTDMEG